MSTIRPHIAAVRAAEQFIDVVRQDAQRLSPREYTLRLLTNSADFTESNSHQETAKKIYGL
jgi:hypothetical protein